jgi:hypothetical protein
LFVEENRLEHAIYLIPNQLKSEVNISINTATGKAYQMQLLIPFLYIVAN